MRKELSWTPVQRGSIYCSPACGANCKLTDYRNAVKQCESLIKKLKKIYPNMKWVPRIWENMGWYWEALLEGDNFSISVDYTKRAALPFGVDLQIHNPRFMQFLVSSSNLESAMESVIDQLAAHVVAGRKVVELFNPDREKEIMNHALVEGADKIVELINERKKFVGLVRKFYKLMTSGDPRCQGWLVQVGEALKQYQRRGI